MMNFFFSKTVIYFCDKPYQEINFKCHSNTAILCKLGKMLSDLHTSGLHVLSVLNFSMKLKDADCKCPVGVAKWLVTCAQKPKVPALNLTASHVQR